MHPVLINIFGYPLHLYAVMIALAFVVGIWTAVRYGVRQGYDRDMLLDLGWWLIVAGLVGSRLAFIVVEWKQYYYPCVDYEYFNTLYPDRAIDEADCTRILRFWNGGLVFYGGAIGGILTMWWFMRREKLPVLPIADVVIPCLALGQFFGRLGCFAAGCCWGAPTTAAWGVNFPKGSMPFRAHVESGLADTWHVHSASIHPVQLYDAFGGLLLFGLLIWLRHRKRYHGQVFIWWMLLYPLWRGTIELFRGDTERGYLFQIPSPGLNAWLGLDPATPNFLSTSQFISLGVMLAAVVILVVQRRRRPTLPDPGG